MSEPFRDSLHDHSRDRFREAVSQHRATLIRLSGEVLFSVQLEIICRMLDVVDQVTDRQTAFHVADALATRWTADVERSPITEAEYRALLPSRMTMFSAEMNDRLAGVLPDGVRLEWGPPDE
jgi:hypothetical protein